MITGVNALYMLIFPGVNWIAIDTVITRWVFRVVWVGNGDGSVLQGWSDDFVSFHRLCGLMHVIMQLYFALSTNASSENW